MQRVVALGQHERLLLVDARALEHRRRRRTTVFDRRDAAFRRRADPRVEPLHQPPRLERQRHRHAARHSWSHARAAPAAGACSFAEQHEHRRLARDGGPPPRRCRATSSRASATRVTRGSTLTSSTWSSSSASRSASCSTAARPKRPDGPSSARSPARAASTRASSARSAAIRIQCSPRRSRRNSTS